jgi:hypothetical protein
MYIFCTAIVVLVHVLYCDSGMREKWFEKHCYTAYDQCRSVNSGNCVNSAQMLQGKFHIQNTVLPLTRSLRGASYENQDPVKCKPFTTTYCAIWVHSYFPTKNSSWRVKCSYLVSNCFKIKSCTFNGDSVSIVNSTRIQFVRMCYNTQLGYGDRYSQPY